MKKLLTVLAASTVLGAGGAIAQVADPVDTGVDPLDAPAEIGAGEGLYAGGAGAGYSGGYYGAGIGADFGADLGYGYGYGAGLLGGSIDESLYGVGIGGLYESEIVGANGEELGEVQSIIRSCNIYAVVNVDAEWLGVDSREIVIPISQMIVTEEGILVEGITRNNVGNFPTYRAGVGLTEIGYGGDTGLTDVGGLYGATQGWGACQQFGGTGVGAGAGLGGDVGEGLGEGVGAVGEGIGEGIGAVGEGVGEGVGAGIGGGAGLGGGMSSGMLKFSLDALEGADVFGPSERELGRIDRLVRSNNAYIVMQIDTGWFGGGGTAIVPLQRFVWTGDGLMLPGVTEETIGDYQLGAGVYGGFWNAGYSEIDSGYYGDVGDIYGYGD